MGRFELGESTRTLLHLDSTPLNPALASRTLKTLSPRNTEAGRIVAGDARAAVGSWQRSRRPILAGVPGPGGLSRPPRRPAPPPPRVRRMVPRQPPPRGLPSPTLSRTGTRRLRRRRGGRREGGGSEAQSWRRGYQRGPEAEDRLWIRPCLCAAPEQEEFAHGDV